MLIRNTIQKIRRLILRPRLVLMYHRVNQVPYDPWELSVSPGHFEEQLKVLQGTGLVRHPDDFLESTLRKGKPGILISFDDGYADNYETALPLLEKYGLPASFFITHSQIESGQPFWWDELAELILGAERLPQKLELYGMKEILELPGDKGSALRELFHQKAWTFLKNLSPGQQSLSLKELREKAGACSTMNNSTQLLTITQLKQLARHPLVHIGGHTHTHPDLSRLSRGEQYTEIRKNREWLESLTGRAVQDMAYPSGRYNGLTLQILKEMGFRSAFTTRPASVRKGQHPFEIGRYHVKDIPGAAFHSLLAGWR